MLDSKKTYFIANWKMYYYYKLFDLRDYIAKTSTYSTNSKNIILCPSYPYLKECSDLIQKHKKDEDNHWMSCGGQDLSVNDPGAYTAEVAAKQLIDVGCKYSIIGHYERKKYYNLSIEQYAKKIFKALESGLKVIACVSDSPFSLDDRNKKTKVEEGAKEVKDKDYNNSIYHLSQQLKAIRKMINYEHIINDQIIIAYEPIWAIGSNKPASCEHIDKIHHYIKKTLNQQLNINSDKKTVAVVYGGSLNQNNSAQILALKNVDGGLFGRVSVDPENWLEIIKKIN